MASAGELIVGDQLHGRGATARVFCARLRTSPGSAPTHVVKRLRAEDEPTDSPLHEQFLDSANLQRSLGRRYPEGFWAPLEEVDTDARETWYVGIYFELNLQRLVHRERPGAHAVGSLLSGVLRGVRDLRDEFQRPHLRLSPYNVLISGQDQGQPYLTDPAPLAQIEEDRGGGFATDLRDAGRLLYFMCAGEELRRGQADLVSSLDLRPFRATFGKSAEAWRDLCHDLLQSSAHSSMGLDAAIARVDALRPSGRSPRKAQTRDLTASSGPRPAPEPDAASRAALGPATPSRTGPSLGARLATPIGALSRLLARTFAAAIGAASSTARRAGALPRRAAVSVGAVASRGRRLLGKGRATVAAASAGALGKAAGAGRWTGGTVSSASCRGAASVRSGLRRAGAVAARAAWRARWIAASIAVVIGLALALPAVIARWTALSDQDLEFLIAQENDWVWECAGLAAKVTASEEAVRMLREFRAQHGRSPDSLESARNALPRLLDSIETARIRSAIAFVKETTALVAARRKRLQEWMTSLDANEWSTRLAASSDAFNCELATAPSFDNALTGMNRISSLVGWLPADSAIRRELTSAIGARLNAEITVDSLLGLLAALATMPLDPPGENPSAFILDRAQSPEVPPGESISEFLRHFRPEIERVRHDADLGRRLEASLQRVVDSPSIPSDSLDALIADLRSRAGTPGAHAAPLDRAEATRIAGRVIAGDRAVVDELIRTVSGGLEAMARAEADAWRTQARNVVAGALPNHPLLEAFKATRHWSDFVDGFVGGSSDESGALELARAHPVFVALSSLTSIVLPRDLSGADLRTLKARASAVAEQACNSDTADPIARFGDECRAFIRTHRDLADVMAAGSGSPDEFLDDLDAARDRGLAITVRRQASEVSQDGVEVVVPQLDSLLIAAELRKALDDRRGSLGLPRRSASRHAEHGSRLGAIRDACLESLRQAAPEPQDLTAQAIRIERRLAQRTRGSQSDTGEQPVDIAALLTERLATMPQRSAIAGPVDPGSPFATRASLLLHEWMEGGDDRSRVTAAFHATNSLFGLTKVRASSPEAEGILLSMPPEAAAILDRGHVLALRDACSANPRDSNAARQALEALAFIRESRPDDTGLRPPAADLRRLAGALDAPTAQPEPDFAAIDRGLAGSKWQLVRPLEPWASRGLTLRLEGSSPLDVRFKALDQQPVESLTFVSVCEMPAVALTSQPPFEWRQTPDPPNLPATWLDDALVEQILELGGRFLRLPTLGEWQNMAKAPGRDANLFDSSLKAAIEMEDGKPQNVPRKPVPSQYMNSAQSVYGAARKVLESKVAEDDRSPGFRPVNSVAEDFEHVLGNVAELVTNSSGSRVAIGSSAFATREDVTVEKFGWQEKSDVGFRLAFTVPKSAPQDPLQDLCSQLDSLFPSSRAAEAR